MSEVEPAKVQPAAAPLRILLIEDDEFDVAVFSRAFRRSDIPCEIVRCRTGEEALDGLRDAELELDLLVTDYQLPGLSGFDLCLRLIEREETEPPFALVLLTGVGSEQMAIRALRAGIHDYIVKDSSREYLELLPLVLPKVALRHRRRRNRRQLAAGQKPTAPGTPPETPRPATGLGLSACADTVKGRGGRIWVENPAGDAPLLHFSVQLAPSEVAFWTAAGREAEDHDTAAGDRAAGTVAAEIAGNGPAKPLSEPAADSNHLLIVHPNPIVTFVAQRTAERAGYRCAAVENGDKAIEAMDREPFDLVLMGIVLPKLDGLETTRRIRRRQAESGGRVTILALGAGAGEAGRCAEAGMDGSVAFPVSARGVQAALVRLG